MTERIQRTNRTSREEADVESLTQPQQPAVADYDALLDQIDAVLEADAEAYVRSFVQKGGQ